MTVNTSDNRYGVAQFIVAPTIAEGANYTTISAALTAASSGQTIFIRPGTYTENLTLKAGVNLTAFGCDSSLNGTGHVIISGNATMSTAGSVTISGIQLQTNSAALLAVTGSVASIVNLENCYLNISNNDGITFSSSSASARINIKNCSGDVGTTGIKIFDHSSAGNLAFIDTDFSNSGASTTASTISAGSFGCRRARFASPITSSGTSTVSATNTQIDSSGQNATALTVGGSGGATMLWCDFEAGSASAVSISSSSNLHLCTISSSNTNAITGAGTLSYNGLSFTGASTTTINTTTQTSNYLQLGSHRATAQPAFLAYLPSADNNVTGDGTTFTIGSTTALTEVFDQASNFNTNGTFTAPITGRYFLCGGIQFQGILNTHTAGAMHIVTSNRTYRLNEGQYFNMFDAGGILQLSGAVFSDMDAADTSTLTCIVSNGTKVVDIAGAATLVTQFAGHLVC